MDCPKMPYLTEEILRTQRVEIYLHDLKDRLQQLRQKHNEVIDNSVEMIKELDEVSSSFLSSNRSTNTSTSSTSNRLQDKMTKIKKLINEFETVKQSSSARLPNPVENRVNIQHILQNFEHLNESHMLKESLVLFRKAKESFEKIDKFFGKLEYYGGTNNSNNIDTTTATTTRTNNNANMNMNITQMRPIYLGNGVRNKINLFNQTQSGNKEAKSEANNKINNKKRNNESFKKDKENAANESSKNITNDNCEENNLSYVSCCSSLISLNKYHSAHNLIKEHASIQNDSIENGYEGDNDDSEYNLHDTKQKKFTTSINCK